MTFAREFGSNLDPLQKVKLALVGAALAVSTLAIAYDVFVYRGAASGPGPEQRAQFRRERAQGVQQDHINTVYEHDTDLQALLGETSPKAESRCQAFHRRRLRDALQRYVDGRVAAQREAADVAADADLPAMYNSTRDAQALREALDLMRSGYLVATEFAEWTPAEEAVFSLPKNVATLCSRPMWEAEKGVSP